MDPGPTIFRPYTRHKWVDRMIWSQAIVSARAQDLLRLPEPVGIWWPTTINLRANGGNTGVVLSIGANTTGIFTDNTHTYTAAATGAMNYQIVTGSTGTSISISFIEVYGNATPAAAATGPKYQHFDNTPRRILGRQNYNPFGGGQMVVFG